MEKPRKSLVKQLAERRQRKVTIAVDKNADPYLHAEARRRGWQLLNLWHCGGNIPAEIQCQGALVTSLPDSDLVQKLLGKGCRVVRLGNLPHPMDNLVPAVLPDYAAYGQRAADHFHARQFHDVGYIGRDPWSDMQPMYEGFRDRAEALGINCHLLRFKELKEPGMSEAIAKAKYRQRLTEFGEWIKGLPVPMALLASGDHEAAKICFMIAQSGLDVPTDVAVLGRGNNVNICKGAMTPISSFENLVKHQIHAACDLLENWLNGERPPEARVMIPPRAIVERQSTRVLAVSDPVVARALRFIWDNFNEPMSVNDVAEAVAVSRSKLDRLFRENFPRGVKEELNRKRLEECRHLLKDTDLTMTKVAAAAGFRSAGYLREVFHKTYGLSPRQFRAACQA